MKIVSSKLIAIPLGIVIIAGIILYTKPSLFRKDGGVKTVTSHASWIVDITSRPHLLGVANNVFVGRVVSQKETQQEPGLSPYTYFDVEVVQNIKGKISGIITVEQDGGYTQEGVLDLLENDPLLVPGNTYLFVTATDGKKFTLVPNYGDILIKDEIEQQKLIQEFEEAYKNEVPYIKSTGENLGVPYVQNESQAQQ